MGIHWKEMCITENVMAITIYRLYCHWSNSLYMPLPWMCEGRNSSNSFFSLASENTKTTLKKKHYLQLILYTTHTIKYFQMSTFVSIEILNIKAKTKLARTIWMVLLNQADNVSSKSLCDSRTVAQEYVERTDRIKESCRHWCKCMNKQYTSCCLLFLSTSTFTLNFHCQHLDVSATLSLHIIILKFKPCSPSHHSFQKLLFDKVPKQ